MSKLKFFLRLQLTTAPNNMKHLDTYITKYMQDFYAQSFTSLRRKIKDIKRKRFFINGL